MIVKYLEDILGSDQDVRTENWNSRRLLLRQDGVGFSLHDTVIREGTENYFWYAHHIEAVYCIEGFGEIEEIATGVVHEIKPGMLYVLNDRDKHYVRANKGTHLRMVCVFNPPLTGREVHDDNGVYPLIE